MPFITSAASLRRLPLFFAYCPDKAGMLSKRMEVRPTHLARWSEEKDKGYGGEFISVSIGMSRRISGSVAG
jgi:hypothetical protein